MRLGQPRTFEDRVRKLTGWMRPEPCAPRRVPELDLPGERERAETCGCGQIKRAILPYRDDDGQRNAAVVCAVCDCAEFFPVIRRA